MLSKNCVICGVLFYKKTKSGYAQWEKRKYCSRKCALNKIPISGSSCYNWSGEKISYNGLHKFIRRKYGNPTHCENCNRVGERLKRNWNIDWSNISGNYNRDRGDWVGLCRHCHIKKDRENPTLKTITPNPHNTIFIHEL